MSLEAVMQKVRNVSSDTALSDEEATLLYQSVSEVPLGGIAVEVGAELGRSSVLIAQVAHEVGFYTLHIDPHTRREEIAADWVKNMKAALPEDHVFTALYMRTDQAEWILKRLAPFDFAYIDGDHEYPGVLCDLVYVADRVTIGGIICCHDYGRDSLPGVFGAVTEYMKSGKWELIRVAGTMGAWRRVG